MLLCVGSNDTAHCHLILLLLYICKAMLWKRMIFTLYECTKLACTSLIVIPKALSSKHAANVARHNTYQYTDSCVRQLVVANTGIVFELYQAVAVWNHIPLLHSWATADIQTRVKFQTGCAARARHPLFLSACPQALNMHQWLSAARPYSALSAGSLAPPSQLCIPACAVSTLQHSHDSSPAQRGRAINDAFPSTSATASSPHLRQFHSQRITAEDNCHHSMLSYTDLCCFNTELCCAMYRVQLTCNSCSLGALHHRMRSWCTHPADQQGGIWWAISQQTNNFGSLVKLLLHHMYSTTSRWKATQGHCLFTW